MYLIYYGEGGILATTLKAAIEVFEEIHGRRMRAKALPGEYVYEAYPDFPGESYGPTFRAIANLNRQRPEEMPRLPVFPFAVQDEWGDDEYPSNE